MTSRRGLRGPDTDGGPTGDIADDPEPDAESVARRIVLDLLTGAPRSRAELGQRLARRGVPAAVADRVLDRFTEVGLVDDKAYAESYVAGRHAGRGLARRALAQELTRKGVAPETAAMALETVDPTTEEQTARALVTKRLPALAGLPADVAERRLVAGLARRGYGPGLAYRVVRDAMGDATDRPPPDADHP